jgi:FixJ family two-component response regulator
MASTSGSSAKSATLVALVDDNASIRRGISRLLSANGFRVETHHSGESFIGRRKPFTGKALIGLIRHTLGE